MNLWRFFWNLSYSNIFSIFLNLGCCRRVINNRLCLNLKNLFVHYITIVLFSLGWISRNGCCTWVNRLTLFCLSYFRKIQFIYLIIFWCFNIFSYRMFYVVTFNCFNSCCRNYVVLVLNRFFNRSSNVKYPLDFFYFFILILLFHALKTSVEIGVGDTSGVLYAHIVPPLPGPVPLEIWLSVGWGVPWTRKSSSVHALPLWTVKRFGSKTL